MNFEIVYSPASLRDLDEIFVWNETTYGFDHAWRYINSLRGQIDGLSKNPLSGKPIPALPKARSFQMRRKSRKHGHVAIYQIQATRIYILRLFHTAQDWPSKFADEQQ